MMPFNGSVRDPIERGVHVLLNDEAHDGKAGPGHAQCLTPHCGNTLATALAAPVEIGAMLCAPARAWRRSPRLQSRIIWSPVCECVVAIMPYCAA